MTLSMDRLSTSNGDSEPRRDIAQEVEQVPHPSEFDKTPRQIAARAFYGTENGSLGFSALGGPISDRYYRELDEQAESFVPKKPEQN